jgi:hypothetical protein
VGQNGSFSADCEVIGQVMIDFASAIGSEHFMPIFEKHGLGDIDPDQWYPVLDLLNALDEISQQAGSMPDLVSIGMKSAEMAVLPPEYYELSIPEIFQLMNEAYRVNVRGTDPGEIACDLIDDRHIRLTTRVPYPDDHWYGVCYGYMRRLAPPGTQFTIYYDDDILRRDLGGDVTVIHVEWE